jgi:predicted  nucleic acid-binding Zn-ribbon protein
MIFLPCFLGGEKLERRIDKNGKPYFVCNNCGIQLFIRKSHGIELLDKLLRDAAKNEIPFKQRADEVYRIQALLTEITGVKQQIERMESRIKFLFGDKDNVRACNLLRTKLENLFKELEELAK